MIEKMKLVYLMIEKNNLNNVIEQFIEKYELQLEHPAIDENSAAHIVPNTDTDPYKEYLNKAEELMESLQDKPEPGITVTVEEALKIIDELDCKLQDCISEIHRLKEDKKKIEMAIQDIMPYRNVNHDIQEILNMRFVKYRFGKIPIEYYKQMEYFVYNELATIFYKCQSDDEYIWGVYFVPATEAEKVDTVYTSLYFQRFYMPDEYEGTLEEAYELYCGKLDKVEQEIKALRSSMDDELRDFAEEIIASERIIRRLSTNFEVRKHAVYRETQDKSWVIISAWMMQKDADKLEQEVKKDTSVYCITKDGSEQGMSKPPTKLKNPAIFRPFEMFIRMYGVPDYDEFDPTIFVAITYSLMFGIMFGDVGHGLLLLIGGFLLYKLKGSDLAAIISVCGLFSTFFGFMFGSIFGFEDLIEPIWIRPISAMSQIPFIGKLNTIFIVAVAMGMGFILLTIIFQIVNSFRKRNLEAALFDTNGITGFIFYVNVILVIVLFMTGNKLPGGIVLALMFGLPLLIMALKEPLTALITHKGHIMPESKGMFFVQAFFELFEVLLSYFSNTLSFVRVGAFAVSHAAMMEVVLMLAGAEHGGTPNIIVLILGNLFVCGMEGLIVGIQVLRLQYYEFFSRFYRGGGREFKSYHRVES